MMKRREKDARVSFLFCSESVIDARILEEKEEQRQQRRVCFCDD